MALFQFLYGTIKSGNVYYRRRRLLAFQFLYGTIKRQRHEPTKFQDNNFNSSMVQLKVKIKNKRPHIEMHFNSSMVQLKVVML